MLRDGRSLHEAYGCDLDKLVEGDRVGVMRTSQVRKPCLIADKLIKQNIFYDCVHYLWESSFLLVYSFLLVFFMVLCHCIGLFCCGFSSH